MSKCTHKFTTTAACSLCGMTALEVCSELATERDDLRQQLAAAQRERDEARNFQNINHDMMMEERLRADAAEKELAAATAELAALKARAEADTRRLDWLEKFFVWTDVDYDEMREKTCYAWIVRDERLTGELGGALGYIEPPTFRAAIDAAMPPADSGEGGR